MNISLFVNRLMLKTPRALHKFLQANQFQMYTCTSDKILIFLYFLFTIIFLSNDVITGSSRKTVRISPIDYIYLGLTFRYQAHLQLSFFKNHIFWQAVNLCKLRTYTKHGPQVHGPLLWTRSYTFPPDYQLRILLEIKQRPL